MLSGMRKFANSFTNISLTLIYFDYLLENENQLLIIQSLKLPSIIQELLKQKGLAGNKTQDKDGEDGFVMKVVEIT